MNSPSMLYWFAYVKQDMCERLIVHLLPAYYRSTSSPERWASLTSPLTSHPPQLHPPRCVLAPPDRRP